MLFAFYFFALVTLGCRVGVFSTELVYLIEGDPDRLEHLYDKDDLYSLFSTLPSFTYVIMGNIIMLFIVEVIAQYKSAQMMKARGVVRSAEEQKRIREKRIRIVQIVRIFVIVEICTIMGLFIASIVIKQ
jgi:hypothetical protein